MRSKRNDGAVTKYIYLNGQFVPEADATVSVYDGGWLHGAGLFETMRAQNGKVFRIESHIDRLKRSAAKILKPVERRDLPARVDFLELLNRNDLSSARVRLTVSAGSLLSEHEVEAQALTVCVTAAPLPSATAKLYEKGIQVAICNFRQSPSDPIAGHKTTAYLPRLLSLREARKARCMEAIWFTTQNRLAEGSISNVFVVRDGMLKTPSIDTPVLPGIARSVVLGLAGNERIGTEEVYLTIDDLLDADEVFLTNSIMQIVPVIRVEKQEIGPGTVGPITDRLRDAYRELVRKECGGE